MDKWWKNPVLQGPENDYGDYDYLINELPENYAKWELSKYTSKCDSCGKYRHLMFRSAYHFHTLDGYDSMDYDECWLCRLKENIRDLKWKLTKKVTKPFKILKETISLYRSCQKKLSFKRCYNLAKKLER